jgi:hypothetical protein
VAIEVNQQRQKVRTIMTSPPPLMIITDQLSCVRMQAKRKLRITYNRHYRNYRSKCAFIAD